MTFQVGDGGVCPKCLSTARPLLRFLHADNPEFEWMDVSCARCRYSTLQRAADRSATPQMIRAEDEGIR